MREEAKKRGEVTAGEDGDLFHLRWLTSCWEVSGTVDLLPAGGVGSRLGLPFSRVRFSYIVGKAAVAMSWNKSSLVCPHPVGVRLRLRQRASGGEFSLVNPLCRSLGPERRCVQLKAGLRAFCYKAAEQVAGFVEVWRLGQARVSLNGGGRRRRVVVHELESLGRGLGQWATADGSIPSLGTSVYFDTLQSQCAMGLFQLGDSPKAYLNGGGRRRGFRKSLVCRGPRGLFIIFIFSRVLCEVWLEQLSLDPCSTSLCMSVSIYYIEI